MSAGQRMAGGVVSRTTTLKLQLPTLLAASFAVQVTGVEPTENPEPEPRVQPLKTAVPQLSAPTMGAANVTGVVEPVHSTGATVGHVNGGGVVSCTVTVPVQEEGLSQLCVGVTVNVTDVVPRLYGPGGGWVNITESSFARASLAVKALAW